MSQLRQPPRISAGNVMAARNGGQPENVTGERVNSQLGTEQTLRQEKSQEEDRAEAESSQGGSYVCVNTSHSVPRIGHMSVVKPTTWLDYTGPENTYVCRSCGGAIIDESTADHADHVSPLITGVWYDEHIDYVSLRCINHPECYFWESSSIELKMLADRRYSLHHGYDMVYDELPDHRP
jgi:hypothetical protein